MAQAPINDPAQPDDFVDVSNLRTTQVDAGDCHTCAVFADFSVQCWGNNGYGEVDPSDNGSQISSPRRIAGYSDVTGVGFTCLVNGGGYVDCWGFNQHGQVGIDSGATPVTTPTRLSNLEGVTSLSVGHEHACAVQERTVDDTLYRTAKCWGHNLHDRTAANTHLTEILLPGDVIGADPALAITAGGPTRVRRPTPAEASAGASTIVDNSATTQPSPIALRPATSKIRSPACRTVQ
ncbi:MAG: alpha-tubulin suppressor-like RCC1 family protein [Candidatus Aldehydirespiratoraceae bacterium]